MSFEAILHEVEFSADHQVVIDRVLSDEIGGYVRSVTVHRGLRVCIAFERYGYDDGGFYLWGQYTSSNELACELESFLGTDRENWTDVDQNGSYPRRPDVFDAVPYDEARKRIAHGQIETPNKDRYKFQGLD